MSDLDALDSAIKLRNQGNKQEARNILLDLVGDDPGNVSAWFWLVDLAINNEQRLELLHRCARHNPENPKVVKALDWMKKKVSGNGDKSQSKPASPDSTMDHPKTSAKELPYGSPGRESLLSDITNGQEVEIMQVGLLQPGASIKPLAVSVPNRAPQSLPVPRVFPNPRREKFSFHWLGIVITFFSIGLILITLIFGWLFRDFVSPVLYSPTPTIQPAGESGFDFKPTESALLIKVCQSGGEIRRQMSGSFPYNRR